LSVIGRCRLFTFLLAFPLLETLLRTFSFVSDVLQGSESHANKVKVGKLKRHKVLNIDRASTHALMPCPHTGAKKQHRCHNFIAFTDKPTDGEERRGGERGRGEGRGGGERERERVRERTRERESDKERERGGREGDESR
jgi:hypothetical protein